MNIFGRRKEDPPRSGWEGFVASCHEHPMARLDQIQDMLDRLNAKTLETSYEFQLQPVVDDITPPNVAPYYHDGEKWTQPIKAERTGQVIQAVLDKLPPSVRSGQDERHEVYQIRLNDLNSWEHLMGTTELLIVFLNCRDEGGACLLFPNDPESHTNWEILKDMHAKQFPQLPRTENER